MQKNDPVVGPSKPRLLGLLGPGLITGASDDDPSGIATYSQAGAQFGFGLTWTLLFSYPLMSVVQEISARIGRTTGHGIAGNMRRYYPNWLLQSVVVLLLIANIINIGADLGAMGDALKLIIGGPHLAYVIMFGVVSVVLQVFLKYSRYVSVLKWLTLSLLAYFGTVLVVHVPWGEVARGLFIPQLTADAGFWTSVVAILGTTISPYLFFWQASQEVEDQKAKPERKPLKKAPEQAKSAIERIRLDTYIGMAFSNLVALAIMITAGATLHASGATDIQSTSQAAEALKPVAGAFAFGIFAVGVIGTGLLAIPVLAGSAGYAMGEARKWPTGLDRKPLEAKAFYVTIAIATLLGACLNFTPVNPIKALYWSAVVNGVVAVPVMAVMMLMTARRDIMGKAKVPLGMRIIGWVATAVMAFAALVMIVQLFWK
ncbi:Nramp family divalent metal transporter [Mesorhizobium sp. NZP2077]|uniref:Nramp family divalent metal transporter n=1 Tax=Mesorhizobium sp. NZP2077 TaxID=2483404 RepID=UPI001551B8F1|nr:Nramp family divalent metal transporter [Mesorhizobium sp. NZP2077]QKC85555.1 divalent metal cation transporter [Mesorhizobium sp. NZP2077]QKD19191.1 Nramp family divalent metal transporter [Mesorhizobium sp. NZP2077]